MTQGKRLPISATYLHSVHGRLRVKLPCLRRNGRLAREIEGFAMRLQGVASATVNPATGSLLVLYDEKSMSARQILMHLYDAGYIDLPGEQHGANPCMVSLLAKKATATAVATVLERLLLAVI